ncbi:hypothetical protein PVAND_014043 [Polypedilum vanderplanki]|uniref:Uncharacterized protein n=1 Tax=Polypedilum vanderplanki TaxID=319348 RepID=A0A9J6CSB6_POLVA|nr:hypothetical protein PVAND_014043 [Polypedilum vanderplanki]
MKLTVIIFIFLIVQVVSKRRYTTPSPFGSLRFHLVKCEPSEIGLDKFYFQNYSCYAKALSRDLSVFNVYFMFKENIYKVWVKGHLEYKYGTIYRPVISLPIVELCLIFDTITENKNLLILEIYKVINTIVPNLVHSCPYKKNEVLAAYNKTFPVEIMSSVFWQGHYKLKFSMHLNNPEWHTLNVTAIVSSVSPIKESFG